jgi:NitT/TauT family transport system ATP-binding protein
MPSQVSPPHSAAEVEPTAGTIEIDGVGLTYPGQAGAPVLAGFNLAVHEREIVCLVGASGCGKSTLLNCVAGFLSPTEGEVRVNDTVVAGPGPDRVMVFQDDAVFPWYSVRGNVEDGLRQTGLGRGERAEKVDRLLRMDGLEHAADRYPRELSGGMRKRCDMARALAIEPEVLLMDEPFAALDVMTKERMQGQFLELWEANRMTVLFVTHDLEEALLLGDRVAVLRQGPGPLHSVMEVPFERPRDVGLKLSPDFQRLRATLTQAINDSRREDGGDDG